MTKDGSYFGPVLKVPQYTKLSLPMFPNKREKSIIYLFYLLHSSQNLKI